MPFQTQSLKKKASSVSSYLTQCSYCCEKHAQEDEKSLEPVHALLPRVNMSHHQHSRSFPFWLLPVTTTPPPTSGGFCEPWITFYPLALHIPSCLAEILRENQQCVGSSPNLQSSFGFVLLYSKNTSCNSLVF